MITEKQKTAIENAWIERARIRGYKPGTKQYARLQTEFFIGAMQTLQALRPDKENPTRLSAAVPPSWYMCLMTDRDIITGK